MIIVHCRFSPKLYRALFDPHSSRFLKLVCGSSVRFWEAWNIAWYFRSSTKYLLPTQSCFSARCKLLVLVHLEKSKIHFVQFSFRFRKCFIDNTKIATRTASLWILTVSLRNSGRGNRIKGKAFSVNTTYFSENPHWIEALSDTILWKMIISWWIKARYEIWKTHIYSAISKSGEYLQSLQLLSVERRIERRIMERGGGRRRKRVER